VVHRRDVGAGQPVGGGRVKKSVETHPEEPEDHALGRSRGGFGSKFTILVDGHGTPLEVDVTAGQTHDSQRLEPVLRKVRVRQKRGRPRSRPKRLAGDKGYSSDRIRRFLKDRGIEAIIPHKDNEKARHDPEVTFDKETYRRRSIVEQSIGWLKECRRIGTRFEKLAINFLAMVKLAMIKRTLKMAFSNRA
jgi:transposase